MKRKLAILANNDMGLYHFRKELIQQLVNENYEVYLMIPYGEMVDKLQEFGCIFYQVSIDRRGTNPVTDLKLFFQFKKLLHAIKPDVVLTYTIKPNIYGGIAARMLNLPYIANITGLGTAIETPGMLQRLTIFLYRIALKKARCVFCQNRANMKFVQEKKIAPEKVRLLPGSGVNLQDFSLQEYPKEPNIRFLFMARIMHEKGVDEFLQAAEFIKNKYSQTEFHICGLCEEGEEEYIEKLKKIENRGIIQYHGMVQDVKRVLKEMHCVVLPSYHEGMSNVLLEAAATGRPIIASNIPGCRECLRDQESGYLVEPKSTKDLIDKMELFIKMPWENKRTMGLKARKEVEEHFDRQQVIEAYMNEIRKGKTYYDNL